MAPWGQWTLRTRWTMRAPRWRRSGSRCTSPFVQVRFARLASTDAAGDGAPRAPAAPAGRPASAIVSVETAIDPNVLGVTIRGDGALRPTRIYEAEHLPPRLVLDFPGLAVEAPAMTAVQLDPVQRVRVARNSPEITRVVLDLVRPSVYEVDRD